MKAVRHTWIATGYQNLFGRPAKQWEEDYLFDRLDYSKTIKDVYEMLIAGAVGSDRDYLVTHHPWADETIMRLYDSVCDIPNLLQEIRKLQVSS
jgi:hypothetical protein